MSIITTFETQCRALSNLSSPDENASRFLVGTLNPSSPDNLIHLFEYKDDNNSLAKISMRFPFGEIWHIQASSKQPDIITAITGHRGKHKASIYKLPKGTESPIENDYGLSESPIEKIFDLTDETSTLAPQSHWHPDNGDRILICNGDQLQIWDAEQQKVVRTFSMGPSLQKADQPETKLTHVCDMRWSSLFNCSVIATAINSRIYGFDTRVSDSSPSSICWLIEDQKCNRIRSLDFNPNSQYYIASGGDDCRANFWDLRRTHDPALYIQTHTHWIWSIRYNPFHDQLVLSAGSDARAVLVRAQSISSEPIGHTSEDGEEDPDSDKKLQDIPDELPNDEINGNDNGGNQSLNFVQNKESSYQDEVIKVYDEHDDSIYSAEWASDPWIFATLGFESRLIINKVPKNEKFNILFG